MKWILLLVLFLMEALCDDLKCQEIYDMIQKCSMDCISQHMCDINDGYECFLQLTQDTSQFKELADQDPHC